jgi:crotonobetainyl-CoA:carnitine CoA-transferase CaiB-like acyl-CoA transferase
MVVEFEHTLGGTLKSLGNPVHMSEMKEQPYVSPPLLGEHTEQVLREVAGYDQQRIERLVQASIVFTAQRFER